MVEAQPDYRAGKGEHAGDDYRRGAFKQPHGKRRYSRSEADIGVYPRKVAYTHAAHNAYYGYTYQFVGAQSAPVQAE